MGTKAKPGRYDCLERAADDEPYFTLIARDRSMPHLLEAWAAVRDSDEVALERAFRRLSALVGEYDPAEEAGMVQEARECAEDARYWRARYR